MICSHAYHRIGPIGITAWSLLGIVAAALGGEFPAEPETPRDQVAVILVNASATVTSGTIRIADIAQVAVDDDGLRQEIESLDVAGGETRFPTVIDRQQVEMRLRLAGFSADRYMLRGAQTTSVRRDLSDDVMEQVLHQLRLELAERWQVTEADAVVTPLQPAPGSWKREATDADRPADRQIEARLTQSDRLGRTRATITVFENQQLQETSQLAIDARVRTEVVQATEPISAGSTIRPDQVRTENRLVDRADEIVPLAEVVGKQTRSSLRKGQIVVTQLLSVAKQTNDAVVKPRDVVRLSVVQGSLRIVVADAVAIGSGNVGDVVQVRNPRSQKVITARVVGQGEVMLVR